MDRVLDGKVVIVTGAGGGIGRESCRVLAAAGAKLVVSDISEGAGQRTVDLVRSDGHEALFIACDVSDEASVKSLVEQTMQAHGRLDGAFNNAALEQSGKPLAELELAQWERVMRVDLTGVFLCMKHQIPAMLAHGGGSIVNTSSGVAHAAIPNAGEYVAAKAGVLGLTRAAAMDYGAHGIRVNAILPGIIRTPMIARLSEDPRFSAMFERARERHIMRRFGQPAEIGEVAKWLLSEAASFVQGAAIAADGGYLAN